MRHNIQGYKPVVRHRLSASRYTGARGELSFDAYSASLPRLDRSIGSTRFDFRPASSRFSDSHTRDEQLFRAKTRLLHELRTAFTEIAGEAVADRACKRFSALGEEFEATGVLVFADLIGKTEFARFVIEYDALMAAQGSHQVLHDFLDLADQALLEKPAWRDLLLHPIFRLLITYRLGTPARIVDIRAKDTFPIDVWAKENILHTDNSPFSPESKVILTWRKGSPLGADGQDLVVLPGRVQHYGICEQNRERWSSENHTIFPTASTLDAMLGHQKRNENGDPWVVKLSDPVRPLTTLFASSDVPHHRYRSSRSAPRSSVTISYQAVPGGHALSTALSRHDATKLLALLEREGALGRRVTLSAFSMSSDELARWRRDIASAPTIETRKRSCFARRPKGKLRKGEFLYYVAENLMGHDVAGLLDLKLYPDGREEQRKLARKMLRELSPLARLERLCSHARSIKPPKLDHIMGNRELVAIGKSTGARCRAAALKMTEDGLSRSLTLSLSQLLLDLSEASARTYSLQCFVSTNLMMFLSVDQAVRIGVLASNRDRAIATALARSYIAGTIGHGHRLLARMPDRNVP